MALEAGIPAGVLNIVSGAAEAGEALVRHPDVGKVTFTGSVPIARIILKPAAENITPSSQNWAASRPTWYSRTPISTMRQ